MRDAGASARGAGQFLEGNGGSVSEGRVQAQQVVQPLSTRPIVPTLATTVLWFLEHGLDLPARVNAGPVVWRRPRYSTLREFIANPAYGGAYAYGRSRFTTSLAHEPRDALAPVPLAERA